MRSRGGLLTQSSFEEQMSLNEGIEGGHRQGPIVSVEGFNDSSDLHCGFDTLKAENRQCR